MRYLITDLLEPDNGCEGFLPGEEPIVTLTIEDGRKIKVPDREAYRRGWDIGSHITDEEINEYSKEDK